MYRDQEEIQRKLTATISLVAIEKRCNIELEKLINE